MSDTAHVETTEVVRNFGGVQAVARVSLEIARGEVHALVGENGAGKSTVGKMIAGVIQPSSGTISVAQEPVRFRSPKDALAHGIAIIDQELALAGSRSVMENVFMGRESRRRGLYSARGQAAVFEQLIERVGFHLDPEARVDRLRIGEQQMVEILRAIARDAELIVMDEPTARLTPQESEHLYGVIRTLRDSGVTIVFISHFLEEVLSLADSVSIMRDGRLIRSGKAAEETVDTLVQGMLGRSLNSTFPELSAAPPRDTEPILEVRECSAKGVESVSLALWPGEIVGLAGLVGSGRTELAHAIFGASPLRGGTISLDGRPVQIRSTADAIDRGIALLPESRKDEGLMMRRSIRENVVLPHLDEISTHGALRRRREEEKTESLVTQLDVRSNGISDRVAALSGGNQQKILFAKWLLGKPRILIVDEPTRGVDIGAKRAIYELIVELAQKGVAILVISSELEEVLGLAHRVLVMRRGSIVADLERNNASAEAVLAAAFGQGEAT